MSLSLSLNNALSGLNINRQSLAVLSQNIANANTKGYSRKILTQQAVYLDGNGAGVSISDVGRKVDDYLLRSIRLQGSAVGRASTLSDYSDRTQLLLGKPGSANSLSSYINTLFNSMQSLAQTPENASLRVNAVNNGVTLARQLSTLATQIQDMRFQADQDIATSVAQINQDILGISRLNKTISSNKLLGKPVTELEDQRDVLLNDLAQYMDVQTYTKSNGELNIFLANGASLVDENAYKLTYTQAGSAQTFVNEGYLGAVNVYRINDSGVITSDPVKLVSDGSSSEVTTLLTSGKLKALLEMRDQKLPDLLEQADMLASQVRDEFNAVHNAGIGFPGASSYAGTRSLYATDFSLWTGSARIAVLGSDGKPISSVYSDETSGYRPLTLDLESLDTGDGAGYPSLQGIIDEINQHFTPQNKVELGNLNNIRLASNSESIPGSPPQFSFDFDLENISAETAAFYVTDVQILDSDGNDMTSLTEDVPRVDLAGTGTYTTTGSSQTVTIATSSAHGFTEGQVVYLSPPGTTVDGIPSADLGGFFTISNVTSTGFDVTVDTAATSGATTSVSGVQATAEYAQVEAGASARTRSGGVITANLTSNTTAPYYDVVVDVAVRDEDGTISTSQVTYRITNSQDNLLNDRFGATGADDDGTLVRPSSTQPVARAMMVDADGNELARVNGVYTTTEKGYLKIAAVGSGNVMAIDSLDSAEEGQPNSSPANDGSSRGFAHYFELNNFFASNVPSETGDTVAGSALAMQVEQRLIDNPNLIALGSLVQTAAPTDVTLPPYYTYERHIGDNSVIQRLAALANQSVTFASAGGLGQTAQTLSAYSSSIIGAAANQANSTKSDSESAQILLDGYAQRSDSISGVNIDEELGNTVIYQNAYSASARVITVVNDLFNKLLETF